VKRNRFLKHCVVVALAIISILLLSTWILLIFPEITGISKSYIIVGKSMEPTIKFGDIILVKKVAPESLTVGDVIVVNGTKLYAHRIIEILKNEDGYIFKTKGDANEYPDYTKAYQGNILGKVEYIIPTSFLRTEIGCISFLIAPFIILAVNNAFKVYRAFTTSLIKLRGLRNLRLRNKNSHLLDMVTVSSLIIMMTTLSFIVIPYYAPANSILLDLESPSAMSIKASTWRVPSSITCSVNSTTIRTGQPIEVFGRLTPPKSGATIRITYSNNSTEVTSIVITDARGVFHDTFNPNTPGVWEITVRWNGDEWYYPSSCSCSVEFLGIEK